MVNKLVMWQLPTTGKWYFDIYGEANTKVFIGGNLADEEDCWQRATSYLVSIGYFDKTLDLTRFGIKRLCEQKMTMNDLKVFCWGLGITANKTGYGEEIEVKWAQKEEPNKLRREAQANFHESKEEALAAAALMWRSKYDNVKHHF